MVLEGFACRHDGRLATPGTRLAKAGRLRRPTDASMQTIDLHEILHPVYRKPSNLPAILNRAPGDAVRGDLHHDKPAVESLVAHVITNADRVSLFGQASTHRTVVPVPVLTTFSLRCRYPRFPRYARRHRCPRSLVMFPGPQYPPDDHRRAQRLAVGVPKHAKDHPSQLTLPAGTSGCRVGCRMVSLPISAHGR
jgi:hypothetical protein